MEKLSFFVVNKMVDVELMWTNNKNLYLKITPEKTLLATAPFGTPRKHVRKFIEENLPSFSKYLEKLKPKVMYNFEQKFVWFFGKKLSIQIIDGFKIPKVQVKQKTMYFLAKDNQTKNHEQMLKDFIKTSLLAYIKARQVELEQIMNIPSHKCRTLYKSSTWGTNSLNNRSISYAAQLGHYSKQVIDYVIIHELAHYKVPNHSQDFWSLVEKYLPNYKTLKAQLKQNHELKED